MEVIEQDKSQLRKIGGSFSKIADRIDSLLKKAEQAREYRMVERKEIFIRHGYNTKEMFDVPGCEGDLTTPLGRIMKDVEELFKRPLQLKDEPNFEVTKIVPTRGQQDCPFDNCNENIYGGRRGGDYLFRNKSSGKEVFMNNLTAHLARRHSLLEKGNEYGIWQRNSIESLCNNSKGIEHLVLASGQGDELNLYTQIASILKTLSKSIQVK